MEFQFGKIKLRIKHAEISLASIIAGLISWACNGSVLWLIVHYFFGLFYVLYWLLFKACTIPNVFDYYEQLITAK